MESADESQRSTFNGREDLVAAVETGCDSMTNRTRDTDNDGLKDFLEICLGTSPELMDTDGDGVNDYIEVEGLWISATVETEVNGVIETVEVREQYYSNPLEADSNYDGQADYAEWGVPFRIGRCL